MCGIVGIVAKSTVNQDLFDALTALQHRGQDAAGVVTAVGHKIFMRKGNGLIRDVVRTRHMYQLQGNLGVGHVRYPTAGSESEAEAQPFYVNFPYGITLAHNGNLTNVEALKVELHDSCLRHLNTTSDSEVLLNVFAHELQAIGKPSLNQGDIFNAVAATHLRCKGAYAAVALIAGVGVVGFRDPHGIRPLMYGERITPKGKDYLIASESVALDALGFKKIDDVAPGEAIFITNEGELFRRQCAANPSFSPCIFEYVYLARTDSIIDKVSVYKVRLRLGQKMGEKIAREKPGLPIDVVMPIPDTSRTAAASLAQHLGLRYREGFIKNRYIGRTFIMPGQAQRRHNVRQKLNAMPLEFKGKNVLLVDDSIVRGTTSKEIIKMAREAGANKVYFASAAPEICYPNVYGIDMPSASELIAHGRTVDEIREVIGADELFYQDLQVLIDAAREGNPDIKSFDTSVFTGQYVTGDINEDYLSALQGKRSDGAKVKRRQEEEAGEEGILVDLSQE